MRAAESLLETAAAADRLGLPEYYAMEAYRVETPAEAVTLVDPASGLDADRRPHQSASLNIASTSGVNSERDGLTSKDSSP